MPMCLHLIRDYIGLRPMDGKLYGKVGMVKPTRSPRSVLFNAFISPAIGNAGSDYFSVG